MQGIWSSYHQISAKYLNSSSCLTLSVCFLQKVNVYMGLLPCIIFLNMEVLEIPSQAISPFHEFKLPTEYPLCIYFSMHLFLPVQLAMFMSDSANSSPRCLSGLPSPSPHTCHAAVSSLALTSGSTTCFPLLA